MLSNRSLIDVSALSLAVTVLLGIALAMPVHAQQATDNSTGGDKLSLPLYYIFDSSMDSCKQDIKENVFEYKFEAAKNDPGKQSSLIKERSNELKNATDNKRKALNLLAENGKIPDSQLAAMADDMNFSIEKLDSWSKNLQEHAADLAMLDNHTAYVESVMPLMENISATKEMAKEIAQEAKTKENSGKGTGTPASPGNPTPTPIADVSGNKNNNAASNANSQAANSAASNANSQAANSAASNANSQATNGAAS